MGNSIIEAQLTLQDEEDKLNGVITIDLTTNLNIHTYANMRDGDEAFSKYMEWWNSLFSHSWYRNVGGVDTSSLENLKFKYK